MNNPENVSESTMKFRRIGGSSQLVIESAKDFRNAYELDPAHWTLTSIPAKNLLCPAEFLALIPQDASGRIHVKDVRNLLKWVISAVADLSDFITAAPALRLAALNTEDPDGLRAKETAELALKRIGSDNTSAITIEQINEFKTLVSSALQNGDGIIPPGPVQDEITAECIKFAMAAVGSQKDISGADGVGAAELDAFEAMLKGFLAWTDEGIAREKELFPYAAATAGLWGKYLAVAADVDDYFESCHALVFAGAHDSSSRVPTNTFDPYDSSSVEDFFKKAPLAPADPACILHLNERVNPNRAGVLAAFFEAFRAAVPGDATSISEAEWTAFKAAIAPYGDWTGRKNTDKLDGLDLARLRAVTASKAFENIRAMIAEDAVVSNNVTCCDLVRKVIICQTNLREFLNNFINMEALFSPAKRSFILAGKLVMNGYNFHMCMIVHDVAAHKKIAATSNVCVMYINATTGTAPATKSMTLAVAVTAGTMRRLFIGKSGVFYTPDGLIWDAVITDLIQQPVSLKEAILMPFYRIGDIIQNQAEKHFAAKTNAFEADVTKGVDAKLAGGEQPKKEGGLNMPMLIMGGGVGIAALGSSFAFMAKSLQGVSVWRILAVLLGIFIIICAPFVILSLLKLFRRSLTRFLEANGCALNREMRLTLALGRIFTYVPRIPGKYSMYAMNTASAGDDPDLDDSSKHPVLNIVYKLLIVILIIQIILLIWFKFFLR
jgi:hypothetical protein